MQFQDSTVLQFIAIILSTNTARSFIAQPFASWRMFQYSTLVHHDNKIDPPSGDSDRDTPWNLVSTKILTDDISLLGCDAVATSFSYESNSMDSHLWLRAMKDVTSNDAINPITVDSSIEASDICLKHPPKEILDAIDTTHRWASDFVRPLHLCPWAGSSLDTYGAIRYWLLLVNNDDGPENALFKEIERVVRAAGKQLELMTGEEFDRFGGKFKKIDASAAISFVILVPMNANNDPEPLPNFESFHDFFLDLEDRLLEECDEYWDRIYYSEDDESNASDIPDGCKFTVAAFHRNWKFNNVDNETRGGVSAIDYEKRTPYPTISIVMSSAIDALMDENTEENSSSAVTNRIADSNEKTLCEIGVEKLRDMFEMSVICPFGNTQNDR